MRGCMVVWCANKANKPGISFFKLTKGRRDEWMKALGRNPTDDIGCWNYVCNEHFVDEDIIMTASNIMKLKSNAIPKLKLKRTEFVEGQRKIDYSLNRLQEEPSTSTFEHSMIRSSSNSCLIENRENIPISCTPTLEIYTTTYSSSSTSGTPDQRLSIFKRKFDSPSTSDHSSTGQAVKRMKRDIKEIHNYSLTEKKILRKLRALRKENRDLKQKLAFASRREKRLRTKIRSVQQLGQNLKKQNLISDDALSVLTKTCPKITVSLMRKMLQNSKNETKGKNPKREKIPEEIRSFALTVQFYSSKAYNYIRKVFNLALPAPSTIRKWMSTVDCKPGFCEESFRSLEKIAIENKNEKGKKTLCSLMLDEMAIKKQIEVRQNKTWGYEDCGIGIRDDSLKEAKEALVLLVVAIDGSWKIPIAYFLINSLTGAEKANVVNHAITKLHDKGITVISVTCDGPSAHFTMAQKLGAEVANFSGLKPYFKHPETTSNVYVIFDACHMVKLIRNNWEKCRKFLNKNGEVINYEYIEKLHKIQEQEGCRLGNKLRKYHIDFKSQKMKVSLAVQTLSSSVADSLEFLMKDVKHVDFLEAGATIEFIRIVDKTFDLLNSRNPFAKGYKSSLKQNNETFWKPILEDSLVYLSELKHLDDKYLYMSKQKTPIVGLSITIKSILGMFEEYCKINNELKYLLTYKFSQDHLELLFCCIRGRNGWNNNPTAYQFFTTFRRLMLKHEIKNLKGNSVALDNTSVLVVSSQKQTLPDISLDDVSIIKKYNIDVNDLIINDDEFQGILKFTPTLSDLTENVVAYIAGFVIKTLKKRLSCPICVNALEEEFKESTDLNYFKLLYRKDRGGLIKPSKDVVETCMFAEKKIRQILLLTDNCMPRENNFIDVFITQTSHHLLQNDKLFKILDDHLFDTSLYETSHKSKILKSIILVYSKIRFFNIAKSQTEVIRGELKRKKLSKQILFSHQ